MFPNMTDLQMKNLLLYKVDWNVDLSKKVIFLGKFTREISPVQNKLIIIETDNEKFSNYLGQYEDKILKS